MPSLNRRNLLLAFAFCIVLRAGDAFAIPLNGFAAMGASETQGTAHSGSWVPYLAVDRGLNFGPSQSYNKAMGGNDTTDLLNNGQHTKVAQLVSEGKVDLSFISVGGLDVPPVALQIVAGTLNVPVWANGVVNRIMTAVDTVLGAGADGMVVVSLPDMALVPAAKQYGLPPALLTPISNAIDVVNAKLKAETLARDLVFVDFAGAMRDLNANGLTVGGVSINMTDGNANPAYFFQDGLHPAVVGNGIIANAMMTALNLRYGQELDMISDQTMLSRTTLAGQYKGETSNLNYSQYVYFNPIPEPETLVLSIVGSVAVGMFAVRRRLAI